MKKWKRVEIEKEMNRMKDNGIYKREIFGMEIILDILGYWACLTKNGYEIKRKTM